MATFSEPLPGFSDRDITQFDPLASPPHKHSDPLQMAGKGASRERRWSCKPDGIDRQTTSDFINLLGMDDERKESRVGRFSISVTPRVFEYDDLLDIGDHDRKETVSGRFAVRIEPVDRQNPVSNPLTPLGVSDGQFMNDKRR